MLSKADTVEPHKPEAGYASHPGAAGGQIHVAIIGGGVAGLATCKALSVRGISCKLFESQPRLGGLWVENYPGAAVQVVKGYYEYPDEPLPPSAFPNPSAELVCDYCQAYARKWALLPLCSLGTRVDRIQRLDSGAFSVTTSPYASSTATTASSTETFSHVVMCTGLTSSAHPFIPSFPGLQDFAGTLLHSSERREDSAELAGRHVVVVGNGKSSMDAATAAEAAGALSVTQLIRKPNWMVPTHFGPVPYPWLLHNRIVQAVLPPYPGTKFPWYAAVARAATAPLRAVIWRSMEALLLLCLRLPRRLWPRHAPLKDWIGSMNNHMANPKYLKAVRRGTIDVRVAEVASVGADAVSLRPIKRAGRRKNGAALESVPVDTLICGTGFRLGLEELGEEVRAKMAPQADGVPLYRGIVAPAVPKLLFVGAIGTFTTPTTVAVQAAWVGETLLGNVPLPPEAEMRREADRTGNSFANFFPSEKRRHGLGALGDKYNNVLLQDMGVEGLARYGGLFGPLANAVLPLQCQRFENAVRPRKERRRGGLRPPAWFKVVVVGVVGAAVGFGMKRA